MSSKEQKEQLPNGDGNEGWNKRCVIWPAAATLHDPTSSLFFRVRVVLQVCPNIGCSIVTVILLITTTNKYFTTDQSRALY